MKNVLNEFKKEEISADAEVTMTGMLNEGVLIAGMVFNNYKDLCKFMGWKVQTGTAKKSQLKELDTLCTWHKEGNKILIDEVYEKKLIKIDKRKEKAIYVDPIKTILFYSLKNFKGELYFSVNQFIKILEMFNQYYYDLENDESCEEVSLTYFLWIFYCITR